MKKLDYKLHLKAFDKLTLTDLQMQISVPHLTLKGCILL